MAALNPRIRDHFLSPRNAGGVVGPSGSGRAENRVCGDVLVVQVRIAVGMVREAGFLAEGCSAVRATASLACEAVEGRPAEEAEALDVALLVAEAGGLPPSKAHAPRVVQRALREALADHRRRCHP